ncbi:MAG TPA: hypothetical protein VF207_01090, partial [Chthoniobacterales bacterium]
IRATRATIHLGVIVAILYMMYAAASRGPPFTALSRQGGYAHILKGYFYETPLSGRELGSMVMLAVKPAGRFLRLKLNSCFRVEQQSPARELFQELPSTGRITSHFSRSRRKANQHSTAPERDIAQQGRR